MNNKVVTRFAPSPTGAFHVGGIRSALYNYLYARKCGGTFILRCEDTDRERSKKEYEDYFLEVFAWLGLSYDAYYRQSERTAVYKKYLEKLIADGKAYVSKEEQINPGDRPEVIRLKNPGVIINFHDEVLGNISFDTKELGDFVIARDLESPLYHLTVVVDDFEMGVTHVLRGQEHVSNTPRQILIQEAIGAPRPVYAHGSIILNEERAKLSKRDVRVVPALEYRGLGYLPEALLNFMALLGWNPGTEQELFTLDELVQAFSLERMHKSGAVFNPDKLLWINKEHIKRLPAAAFTARLKEFSGQDIDLRLAALVQERAQTLAEAAALLQEYHFFEEPVLEPALLLQNGKIEKGTAQKHLAALSRMLSEFGDEDFIAEKIKSALFPYATAEGRGAVLWPLRIALSGAEKSPDPFTIAALIGKEKTLGRIARALRTLG